MERFNLLLPLWALVATAAGYLFHTEVAQFHWALFPVIAIVMFTMGLTLTVGDFLEPFHHPSPLILGVFLQFLLMPLLAWSISTLTRLPTELFIGMVLVGAAPGGTASNVLTYLAGGRVALSVGMTTFSTLVSVIVTPWLTGFYLHQVIEVDRLAMLISIAKMIVLPVLGGISLRAAFPGLIEKIAPLLPSFAVASIALAICIVVALNAGVLDSLGIMVILAVLLHNLSGLCCGYGFARLARFDRSTARTIAIEVGTQNSGMAAALAVKHFSVLTAVPSALFSVLQNIFGTLLASYWSKRPVKDDSIYPRL